jgi:hypothetical protein
MGRRVDQGVGEGQGVSGNRQGEMHVKAIKVGG